MLIVWLSGAHLIFYLERVFYIVTPLAVHVKTCQECKVFWGNQTGLKVGVIVAIRVACSSSCLTYIMHTSYQHRFDGDDHESTSAYEFASRRDFCWINR